MKEPVSIEGTLECEEQAALAQLAESVDKFVGAYPRLGGYDVAGSMAAILNGGTLEQITTAFRLLDTWTFQPKGGW